MIAGDGPERTKIEKTIRALGLMGAVTLVGQIPSAEPYYGIADVCVLSSRSEGSPNALLEAMAAGVQPGDSTAMAGAIASLLADAALARRLADRSRQLVLERHDPQSRTRRLVETYRRLVVLGK